MKKEYVKPAAEKVEFNYSDNVTASNSDRTDAPDAYWQCGTRYNEEDGVCGQTGNDVSTPYWECK